MRYNGRIKGARGAVKPELWLLGLAIGLAFGYLSQRGRF